MIRNPARFADPAMLGYLARSAATYMLSECWRCPCCGATDHTTVARKAVVTALVRCASCKLLYRCPCDPAEQAGDFYQDDYVSGGLTTSLPDDTALARLVQTGFKGSQKDFSDKIALLPSFGVETGARVLDFGASWGYATWQLRAAGYAASGYEISEPRAQFGRDRLGLEIESDAQDLAGPFDAVFSSHVIEHFPNPRDAFEMARHLLRPGGLFVAFTPNGSLARLPKSVAAYNHSWGRLHPVYLDDVFYRASLPYEAKFLTSRHYGDWADVPEAAAWNRLDDATDDLGQPELLFAFVNGGED